MNPMNQPTQTAGQLQARCCIAGGGPAGMMLGFLLARAGVEVIVLEKHKDFLRDFRGDTIHPSTLELMYELGLLEEFLRQPHQEVRQVQVHFGAEKATIADFSHLPTHCKFIAFMPQWDFLNFISTHAWHCASFRLRMEAEVTDLLFENERIIGVRATTPQGELEVRADLVVGADGRSSTVRERADLEVMDLGAPIDVLWFGLSKRPGDPEQAFGYVGAGQFMVLLDRGDHWQCGYVIRKCGFEQKRQRGLEELRADVSRCAPFLHDRVAELKDWNAVKLLKGAPSRPGNTSADPAKSIPPVRRRTPLTLSRKANHPSSEPDNSFVRGRSRNEPPLTWRRTAIITPPGSRTSRSIVKSAHSWYRQPVKKRALAR
jgi:2-polyprenyl-6-methoxyphenol hydroxylase-like FAD-dependent oxidoreductase